MTPDILFHGFRCWCDRGYDSDEAAVAIVVIENVRVGGEPGWTAHDGDAFPLTGSSLSGRRSLRWIKLNVVADEEIQASVAVVVEEGATRPPAHALVIQASLPGHVSEGAVAVFLKR